MEWWRYQDDNALAFIVAIVAPLYGPHTTTGCVVVLQVSRNVVQDGVAFLPDTHTEHHTQRIETSHQKSIHEIFKVRWALAYMYIYKNIAM
jgi:hypothetical protein